MQLTYTVIENLVPKIILNILLTRIIFEKSHSTWLKFNMALLLICSQSHVQLFILSLLYQFYKRWLTKQND